MAISNKQVLKYLDDANINYQVVTHPPVYTAEEADRYVKGYQFGRTKNLFLKSKEKYYLVAVLENKRLDMKKLKLSLQSGRLSFASQTDLTNKLAIRSGAVSPFNLMNNAAHDITFILDRDILNDELIGCHPNDNTATVILKVDDLVQLIKKWSNQVEILSL